jgi:hypothetical protein
MMLGIDVNETREVTIGDAVFSIGILPYRIKIKLDSCMAGQYAGKTKEEIDKVVSENLETVIVRNADYVRYGVRGHKGITTKDGKEIPCVMSSERVGTREVPVVSDETMDLYFAAGVFPELIKAVLSANEVSQEERKN